MAGAGKLGFVSVLGVANGSNVGSTGDGGVLGTALGKGGGGCGVGNTGGSIAGNDEAGSFVSPGAAKGSNAGGVGVVEGRLGAASG